MTDSEALRQRELDRQVDLARLRELRPMDDDFMRCIFRDNLPLAQLVLRILTGKPDLLVTGLSTQKDLKRLVGARSVCLDAYAEDANGKKYDLEIQRSDAGAGAKRARYHASAMDIENLDAGQDFVELPETYVIFITETDVIGGGKPCYRIERVNLDLGEAFQDGTHILYINGENREDTPLGKLMHDFSCRNPEEMHYELLRAVSKYYKETQEGVEYMCRAFEETRKEGFERGIQQGLQRGLQQGIQQGLQQGEESARISGIRSLMETLRLTEQQAMDALRIPPEERARYAGRL